MSPRTDSAKRCDIVKFHGTFSLLVAGVPFLSADSPSLSPLLVRSDARWTWSTTSVISSAFATSDEQPRLANEMLRVRVVSGAEFQLPVGVRDEDAGKQDDRSEEVEDSFF